MNAPAEVTILGGTGPLGRGLALRLARAGVEVCLGSRDQARAQAEAAKLGARLPLGSAPVSGTGNAQALPPGRLAILAVPYSAQPGLLGELGAALGGRIVVSTAVPMAFAQGLPHPLHPEAGSAAEEVAALCPQALVVGAFHTVSADNLGALERELDEDILVSSDHQAAKLEVQRLVETVPGLRGVDAGPLANAAFSEGLTPFLLRLNRVHRARAGVRITGLP